MKRDVYNGKVDALFRGTVTLSLIAISTATAVLCTIFWAVARFVHGLSPGAQFLLYLLALLTFGLAIYASVGQLHLIRIYPKYRRLTRLLVQEHVFRAYGREDLTEQTRIKNGFRIFDHRPDLCAFRRGI